MTTPSEPLFHAVHHGPLGPVHLLATTVGLCRVTLPGGDLADELRALGRRSADIALMEHPDRMAPHLRALDAFFDGREPPADLALDLKGTPFQRAVWSALRGVSHGTVVTYGELARLAGRPRASRAVGTACGANPVPLLVPCHRVVAAGPSLGGFGGGPALKRALLEREGIRLG